MAKSKRPTRQTPTTPSLDPRERGLRAFQAGRFNEAIAIWSLLVGKDARVRTALAEAHFRRALSGTMPDSIVSDLRRAIELVPNEARYHFHLGRMLHRNGDLAGANTHYRQALQAPAPIPAAAQLLALATLQQAPQADLSNIPGMTPALQRWFAPIQALLRAQPLPSGDDSPVERFWRGLALIAAGDPAALDLLADDKTLPAPSLLALGRYYRGVAAARGGDTAAALKQWQAVHSSGYEAQKLHENLAVLLLEQLNSLDEKGDLAAAAALARQWAALPGNAAFDVQRLLMLDRGAQAAAAEGNWAQATDYWEAAREILGRSQSLGSPRPLLHNLALAYERQELWMEAADAWRAMLRTRPRKKAAAPDAAPPAGDLSDERWAWVRERIINCYRNAGRPDEAVTVFRQALKADPNDLDTRVQLADALMANEQERAAYNEVQRILQIDPHHAEALFRKASYLSARWEYPEAEQIVRDIAARNPERDDLRARVANFFLNHGRQYAEYSRYDAAYNAFIEGERYQPDNYLFPLNQARMIIYLRRREDVQPLIERAITLAGDSIDAWTKIIETWVIADRIDEARALLERFERGFKPDVGAYIMLGTTILLRTTPPPPPSFGLLPSRPAPKPVDTPWTTIALDLIDKALALKPDDVALHKSLAGTLMLVRPDLARRFAEAAVSKEPDDPNALILLGIILGLDEQVQEAKKTLLRAGQMARRQNRPDIQEQAQELRGIVGTPFFRTMIQAGLSGEDIFDDDDFDDDEFL